MLDCNVITEFYQNRTILLTGVTGFLGQAIASKILRDLSQVRRLYVLVRSKKGRGGATLSATERLEEEFFNSSVLEGFKRSEPEEYQRGTREGCGGAGGYLPTSTGYRRQPLCRSFNPMSIW